MRIYLVSKDRDEDPTTIILGPNGFAANQAQAPVVERP